MQRLSFLQLSSCQVSTGTRAMHHLSGFYVDSGDLGHGSHANTANILSTGALSRAPFFLCFKKCKFWGSNSSPWVFKVSTFTELAPKFLEFGFHSYNGSEHDTVNKAKQSRETTPQQIAQNAHFQAQSVSSYRTLCQLLNP